MAIIEVIGNQVANINGNQATILEVLQQLKAEPEVKQTSQASTQTDKIITLWPTEGERLPLTKHRERYSLCCFSHHSL